MERKKARRRALRAAQVVSLGLAIAGCGDSHELGMDAGPIDAAADVVVDAAPDAFDAAPDVVVVDVGPDAMCPDIWPPTTPECCEQEAGGYWDEESGECWVAVPGPFIPPSMNA